MDFLTLNHRHLWARSHLLSQSNCQLEFQEVAYHFLLHVFRFSTFSMHICDILIWCVKLLFTFSSLLSTLCQLHVSQLIISDYEIFFQEKRENNLLNPMKKTVLIPYKEILKVSIYKKLIKKEFQNYRWQYYHDTRIPDVSSVYKKSQKAGSKKICRDF